MNRRLRFDLTTNDTGRVSDTGNNIHGELHQMRWVPTGGDTGGDLILTQLLDADDTGSGRIIFSENGNMAVQFNRAPRQGTHDISGDSDITDTGTSAELVPIYFAGENLKVQIRAGDTGSLSGSLYVWMRE